MTERAKLCVPAVNLGAFPNRLHSPVLSADADAEKWFAVQTRARHEKVVAQEVRDRGVTTFLPLVREVRRWSDRRKVVELPLFSCYVFVKLVPRNDERLRVLRVNGALRFVGTHGMGIPIPDEQIQAVQTLVEEQLPFCSHPFLKIGQRVRIRSGALTASKEFWSREAENVRWSSPWMRFRDL